MSNNTPDYENDLVFPPPQGDWADTRPQSNTDRTASTIELISKIERLTKQLEIAVKALQYYANENIYDRHHQVVNGNNEWESEVMLDCGVKADYALKIINNL